MSADNMENYQETKNMVDYVDDTSEQGRISYVLRRWRKAINDINKKIQQAKIEDDPFGQVFAPCSQTLSNNVGDHIKL
jgi:hypothetical protein